MGISIQASGEAIYLVGGEQFRISAASLRQGNGVLNAPASFKGDNEYWLMPFSADTKSGLFTWHVSYSMGLSGACFEDAELVSKPAGVEVIDNMVFKVVDE